MRRLLDSLFGEKRWKKREGSKFEGWPAKTRSPRLPYCRSSVVICVAAQVAWTQLRHIYWLVMPLKAKSCLCLTSCWGVCPPSVCACVCGGGEGGGQRLLKFNKASEKMRRRTCLPLGAELCGQVQISWEHNVGGANSPSPSAFFSFFFF